METPALAPNEELRLKTLYDLQILDTQAEERFDRITRVASKMFQVPIALVSLVDRDRQWFKSCVGLDISETPREPSFCGHAILGDTLFYVPDASKDPRFADNPMVTGPPHIRFYAGHPLTAPNGEKLGTLCLIDQSPREFTGEDVLALESLAQMVESELSALRMATVDDLTSLSNRRGFEMLARQIVSFNQRQEFPISCAFFDLDKFKPINDIYGHQEGDRALKLFSEHLKKCIRESDIAARIGGDEFIALLNNCTVEQAQTLIERLSSELSDSIKKLRLEYDIEFSFGIEAYQCDKHETISQLIEAADHKMYQQKAMH